MAKVTLEFDSIEEAEDLKMALDGWRWQHSVWQFDQHLRAEIKYNDAITAEEYAIYERLRDKLREVLDNNNLTL